MVNLEGKRILILGGSRISIEIVKKAQEKGMYTIVTDWYSYGESPAKQIADKSYQVSTKDMTGLLDIITKEKVDGIITGFTDSTLPFYSKLCELSGLPCYGNEELFNLFTDKKKYKKKLREFNIPIVEDYDYTYEELIANDSLELDYPVLVKPSDSSGSRGVSICRNYTQLIEGYENALRYSESKNILIERYINGEEATLFFLFDNGEIYLSGLGSRHVNNSQGKDVLPLLVGYSFPSALIPTYVENTLPQMKAMFKDIGIENGMLFAQCLVEDGECLIYDIGYRLTGSIEYALQEKICGYNPLEMMLDFAITGDMFANTDRSIDINPYWKKYGYSVVFLMRTGMLIDSFEGLDAIQNHPSVIDTVDVRPVGNYLPDSAIGQGKQIFLRVLGEADSVDDMKNSYTEVYNLLSVTDNKGNNIVLEGLNVSQIDGKVM